MKFLDLNFANKKVIENLLAANKDGYREESLSGILERVSISFHFTEASILEVLAISSLGVLINYDKLNPTWRESAEMLANQPYVNSLNGKRASEILNKMDFVYDRDATPIAYERYRGYAIFSGANLMNLVGYQIEDLLIDEKDLVLLILQKIQNYRITIKQFLMSQLHIH